ncbi:MAG TPA: galactose oxidase-like domain-containing protein [Gemmatimonadales bacterium]|nr:galactose oxidase-like domain-containing protein [Gemmatimonadales bacterium]
MHLCLAVPRRAFLLLALSVSACGGGDSLVVSPTTGTLTITTSTAGDEPDEDGYTVQVNSEGAESIGSANALTRTGVAAGTYSVLLAGMAPNCTVAGDNPRTVSVVNGETTSITFAVTCLATTGSLQLSVTTTGASLDPDGYSVALDGTDRSDLGVNGSVTLTGIVPGSHVVGLGDVAGNCLVQDDNLRVVTIVAGASAQVAFDVTCSAPPLNPGTVRLTTVTTGPDQDQDGYSFALDGGSNQPIGTNGEASVTNVAPGAHSIQLAAFADNCTVQGTNPRSVTVPEGATANLGFVVLCAPISGGIRVSVTTSGASIDVDGYAVQLDGNSPGQRIGTTGSVSFNGLLAGSHSVGLSGLAPNCSVAGDQSRTVSVIAGAVSEISFSVACTSTGGASRLEKVSGDAQSGLVGSELGTLLVIRATDAQGTPIQGVTVAWTPGGGGSVSETASVTGANGQTSVTRTLGGTPGQQTTVATVDGLVGSPLTFTHTATASGVTGVGRWDPAFTTPVVGVHMHLLMTGKVLLWGDIGDAQLWSSATGFTPVPKSYRIYCSGHTFLPDGRLLVVGGTSPGTRGLRVATVFDPLSSSWSATGSMAQGRYYPTTTTLPNGDILAVSGHDTAKTVVTIPEVRSGGAWRQLTTAPLSIPDPYYPAMFVAPNGKVFLAGFPQETRYLDVAGTGQWTMVANRKVADRTLGSAVMYAPGKILYAGGGDPPTRSAEVIDLNQPAPSWRTVSGMAFARRQMNATILADGSVLVTGGTGGSGFNDQAGAVRRAELWNPRTESWSTMAAETDRRTYHGTALLLPTGQVLSSGSGEGGGITYANSEFSAQVFSPPYLFNPDGSPAARPSITSAPATLSYGQSFTIHTPNAASVSRGTLIRLSSVTHAFNASQLIYPLTFEATSPTSLSALAPANGNLAPPGPYMLFLVDGSGVPSVATFVTVGP